MKIVVNLFDKSKQQLKESIQIDKELQSLDIRMKEKYLREAKELQPKTHSIKFQIQKTF